MKHRNKILHVHYIVRIPHRMINGMILSLLNWKIEAIVMHCMTCEVVLTLNIRSLNFKNVLVSCE